MKKKILFLGLFLVVLSSCQSSEVSYNYPEDPDLARKERAGKYFDDISLSANKSVNDQNQQFNQKLLADKNVISKGPLWMASIEVIGNLLPIAVVENESGLIITEWSSGNNQRTKISLLVRGKEIKAENLILSIFKQSKDNKGKRSDQADNSWVDDEKSDQVAVKKLIKDKILSRAAAIEYKKPNISK